MKAFAIVCLMIAFRSFGQSELGKQDTTFELFDIVKYKELQALGKSTYYLQDSSKVKFFGSSNYYEMKVTDKFGYFGSYKEFYKDSYRLRSSGTFFQSQETGVWKTYDSSGVVVAERNCEAGYSKSFQDIIRILKTELRIDVYHLNGYRAVFSRSTVWEPARYEVVLHPINSDKQSRMILIDATSGEIMSSTNFETKRNRY